jgi:hypothetical protein
MLFSVLATLLATFSTIASSHPDLAPEILWDSHRQSALIKLSTPGYPLYTIDRQHAQKGLKFRKSYEPSALILNFTTSQESNTLLLQYENILPLPNPSVPPLLRAYQVPDNLARNKLETFVKDGAFASRMGYSDALDWALVGISYGRVVTSQPFAKENLRPFDESLDRINTVTEDEETASRVMLDIDVVAATTLKITPDFQTEETLLDVPSQKTIRLHLTRVGAGLQIEYLTLLSRGEGYVSPSPPTLDSCTLSSWRCCDLPNRLCYRYVWFNEFDEHGRKNSLRHAVEELWFDITYHFSHWWLEYLIALCSIGAAVIFGFIIYSLYQSSRTRSDKYAKEEEQNLLRHEAEGLLQTHDEVDDPPPYVEVSGSYMQDHLQQVDDVLTDKALPPLPVP